MRAMSDIRAIVLSPPYAELAAALHAICFETGWPARSILDGLHAPGGCGWLALHADTTGAEDPIGLLMARQTGDQAEILTLATRPDRRRCGVAARLLETATAALSAAGAARLFLEVADDNRAARALYDARGFVPVGRRKAYYRRGNRSVDALVMARDLGMCESKRRNDPP